MAVRWDEEGSVAVVTIDRPKVRNAVDTATAGRLVERFLEFEARPELSVAVLTGAGGTFCAGFDLKALARGEPFSIGEEGPSPMGPARLDPGKPVIAAIEGYAVGGGFELALWCDLRVAARDAVFGLFNRRFGVPCIDGGTVRLPRLIGESRAMDLLLTGRAVGCEEALAIGLVNRLAEPGGSLEAALELARHLASLPQEAMRGDRASARSQWGLSLAEALRAELRFGLRAVEAGEAGDGARRFVDGAGRHGEA
jgi:enoyl-CoA hydratase